MKSKGSTLPAKASGVTTMLTSGIAMALASGDTSDICWNQTSSSGAKASVIAHWTRPH